MTKFSKKFTVTNNLLTTYDYLKPSAILDYAQEIAGNHADELGVGFNEFIKNDLIWIIVRNKVQILKTVKQIKETKVDSFITKPRLFELPRDYVFYHNDEEIIHARSIWVIFNLKEKRVVVPTDYKVLFTEDEGLFPRIKKLPIIQKDNLHYEKDFVVPYSYLDHNGHMNNTHYLDLFLDIFKPQDNEIIKEFQVEYISQCYLGDTLSLYSYVIENKKYLYGYCKDELKFYLEVIF